MLRRSTQMVDTVVWVKCRKRLCFDRSFRPIAAALTQRTTPPQNSCLSQQTNPSCPCPPLSFPFSSTPSPRLRSAPTLAVALINSVALSNISSTGRLSFNLHTHQCLTHYTESGALQAKLFNRDTHTTPPTWLSSPLRRSAV